MRVSLVDPSAFTPPYDRSLAAALARAGAEVELVTSRFLYGPVPAAEGYAVSEPFYRLSSRLDASSRLRLPRQGDRARPGDARGRAAVAPRRRRPLAVGDACRSSTASSSAAGGPAARVLTLHYPLPAPGRTRALRSQARFLAGFDAVITHTDHGAGRLRDELGLDPARVHVIPHGPLDYLPTLPDPAPLPPELAAAPGDAPVILFFGLLRPYKGIDTLLEAFAAARRDRRRAVDRGHAADAARAAASGWPRPRRGPVRWLPRFVTDDEIPALMERADVLALPYREIEQSGVLYAGLAFGKAMVLGDVGGFGEVGREQAPRGSCRRATRPPWRRPSTS